MKIQAEGMHFQALNDLVRQSGDSSITIDGCIGQRYIASGSSGKTIKIHGVPGNALGAYLNGTKIEVFANAQDAIGDTMNDGVIMVHGRCGDAPGYAMRGGRIYIEGDAGYRAGIHMKAYQQKLPVLVIGGAAGSFLGEYQAGGLIIVLGLSSGGKSPIGYFCGTGMHGGKILLRCDTPPEGLPKQVCAERATPEALEEIRPYVEEFCRTFGKDADEIMHSTFYMLTPNSKTPYKQLYTNN